MVGTKKLSLIQDDTHFMSDQRKCFRLCCRMKAGNTYHVGKLPSLQYSVAEALKSLAGCRQTEAWYRVLGQRLCGHDSMYCLYIKLCALDMLWLCLIKRTLLCNGKTYFNCLVLNQLLHNFVFTSSKFLHKGRVGSLYLYSKKNQHCKELNFLKSTHSHTDMFCLNHKLYKNS